MTLVQALLVVPIVLYYNDGFTCLFSLIDYELSDTSLFIIYLYPITVLNQYLLSETKTLSSQIWTHTYSIYSEKESYIDNKLFTFGGVLAQNQALTFFDSTKTFYRVLSYTLVIN